MPIISKNELCTVLDLTFGFWFIWKNLSLCALTQFSDVSWSAVSMHDQDIALKNACQGQI